MGKKRGSEGNPIDLTEDEELCKTPCTISKSVTVGESKRSKSQLMKNMSNRITLIENLIRRKHPVKSDASPGTVKQSENLSERCRNLESRVSALEKCFEGMRQAFLSDSVDMAPIPDEDRENAAASALIEESQDLTAASTEERGTLPYQETGKLTDTDILTFADNTELIETSSICSEETVVLGDNMAQTSSTELDCNPSVNELFTLSSSISPEGQTIFETIVDSGNGLANSNVNNYYHIHDHVGDPQYIISPPAFQDIDEGNELISVFEETENSLGEAGDMKPDPLFIRLPKLTSLKQEVNFKRDDFGRILMFLCCSAKKILKDSNDIVAVSGMYLEDQLHNEHVFTSQSSIWDVKVEAQIKAALFGIEAIKCAFNQNLSSICVMIISSCKPLVQLMKAGNPYPNFFICSCGKIDCEHSSLRWSSQDPIAISQKSVLPEFFLSKENLKVHWCFVNNISDEEKNVLTDYKNVVESVLSEYVKWNKKNNLPQLRNA